MSAEEVLARRAQGDWSGAIALAIDVWRRTRAGVVADAIEALDREQPLVLAIPIHKATFHDRWLEFVRDDDPLTRGALARSMPRCIELGQGGYGVYGSVARQFKQVLERVHALGELGTDPRIASALMGAVARSHWGVGVPSDAEELYGPMLAIVEGSRDERQVALAEALLARPRSRSTSVRDYLARRLPQMIRTLGTVAAAPLADEAVWRTIVGPEMARADEPAPEELLAAIAASPDDDEPRLVYADWLAERGDPRGELIHLQTSGTTPQAQKEARALLRTHQAEWLGPDLTNVLVKIEFRRGFLDSAELAQNAAADEATWERAASAPALATLRRLVVGRGNITHYLEFILSDATLSLETIEVPTPGALQSVLAQRTLAERLRSISLRRAIDAKAALAISKAMPRLDEICLSCDMAGGFDKTLRAILEAPIGERLRTLGLVGFMDGRNVARVLEELPQHVTRLVLGYERNFRIDREDGAFVMRVADAERRDWAENHYGSVLGKRLRVVVDDATA